jgi:hypothetical protein
MTKIYIKSVFFSCGYYYAQIFVNNTQNDNILLFFGICTVLGIGIEMHFTVKPIAISQMVLRSHAILTASSPLPP